MSKIRVNKTKDYTVLSNHHLRNKNLSLKAKGLLSVMLSLPESWDYSVIGLVAICKENETAIKSTLDELKANGYLKVTKLYPSQTKSGRYEYIYDIYELPKQDNEKQEVEKQGVENLGVEFLGVENIGLNKDTNKLNTKELNTNKENTNNININVLSLEQSEFENLWKIYKKKTSKDKSLKAYIKARNGYKSANIKYPPVSLKIIEQGLQRYNDYLERNNTQTQFIKDFSTWLNGRCWEDDYNEVPRQDRGFAF